MSKGWKLTVTELLLDPLASASWDLPATVRRNRLSVPAGSRSATEHSKEPACFSSPYQATLSAGSRQPVIPERGETCAPSGSGSGHLRLFMEAQAAVGFVAIPQAQRFPYAALISSLLGSNNLAVNPWQLAW